MKRMLSRAEELIRGRGFTSVEPDCRCYADWSGPVTALSALGTAWEESKGSLEQWQALWNRFRQAGGSVTSSREETLAALRVASA